MLLRLLCAALVLSSLAWTEGFDKPLSKKIVDLGPSPSSPHIRAKITCYWFASFMIKEIDLGEKGASNLAIVPSGRKNVPPCKRRRSKGEMTVNPDDWSGYFKGVKGSWVLFNADDGWNGGLGFAVYDSRSGKKVFDDVALGNLDFYGAMRGKTVMRYTRVADGGCNLPKEGGTCWDKIRSKLGVERSSAPECKAAYEKSAHELAKDRCQAQNAANPQCLAEEIVLARQQTGDVNSIIAYAVEGVLSKDLTVKPIGGNMRCWPSD